MKDGMRVKRVKFINDSIIREWFSHKEYEKRFGYKVR